MRCFVSRVMQYWLPEDLLESIRVNMILTAGIMDGYCCVQEWCPAFFPRYSCIQNIFRINIVA